MSFNKDTKSGSSFVVDTKSSSTNWDKDSTSVSDWSKGQASSIASFTPDTSMSSGFKDEVLSTEVLEGEYFNLCELYFNYISKSFNKFDLFTSDKTVVPIWTEDVKYVSAWG